MYRLLKRFCDIVFSLFAILILAFPWLIIALIIKLQSPGPLLYKPERVGLCGKTFTLYKFRTMCVDSGNIHSTTLRTDPRVYSFGKFLRKSKLDETPQFINILKGDMSIIGPRPEDKINSEQIYKGEFCEILSVKPGLSSPASLYDFTHGEQYSSEEEYNSEFLPQKLGLELYYVKKRGLFYDIKIVFRTVAIIIAVIFGKKNFKKPWELEKIASLDDNKIEIKELSV